MAGLTLQVTSAVVVLVAMLMLMVDDSDAYSSYSRGRRYPSTRRSSSSSFYNRFGSGRSYSSPKARYVHSFGSTHPHPHRPQAIGVPIRMDYDDLDDIELVNRVMPYGYGEQLLLPIEGLLRDLAGYTGYTQNSVPGIVRNIKHEFYIGANKRDPYLHNILKRYGFMFTGNPSDLGMGVGGQGGLNNLLGSIGLGGNGGGYGGGAGMGVSSVQNPMPGVGGVINDDLFDDFGNGLLASSNTASTKQENTLNNNNNNNNNDPLGLLG